MQDGGVNLLLRNSVIRWDTNSSALSEGLVHEPINRSSGDQFTRPASSNRLFEDGAQGGIERSCCVGLADPRRCKDFGGGGDTASLDTPCRMCATNSGGPLRTQFSTVRIGMRYAREKLAWE